MDGLESFIFGLIGLKGTSLLVFLIIVSMICQVISRLIPEDATGWRKVVKTIAAVVGLHVANRITGNITLHDVAREVIREAPVTDEKAAVVRELVDERIEDAVEPLELTQDMRHVTPAFPGRMKESER